MSIYEQLGNPMCPKRQARRMCAEAFGVEEHRLIGASRVRDVVIPRHATFYVLRHRFPDMSLPRIGRLMGGRDHSTILYGIRNIEALMERDDALRILVHSLAQGRIPIQHDAHVVRWLAAQHEMRQQAAAEAAFRAQSGKQIRHAVSATHDAEYQAALDPSRVHCDQCDRAVREAEAARCTQRLCKFKAISGRRAFA